MIVTEVQHTESHTHTTVSSSTMAPVTLSSNLSGILDSVLRHEDSQQQPQLQWQQRLAVRRRTLLRRQQLSARALLQSVLHGSAELQLIN